MIDEHLRSQLGAAKEYLQFAIEPVAEYLAALYLVDQYNRDPLQWQEFITQLDVENNSEPMKQFLFTLRDCYLATVPGANVNDFLPRYIGDRFL